MRHIAAAVAFLSFATAAVAQLPIGFATPVSGYTASLSSEPLWLGNMGFGYTVRGAPPGGSALIAVAAARQDQLIGGLQVYLDLASIITTHATAIDGTGQAFFPVPLGGPEVPSLAGVQAWAQAAVTDPASPGALGTTQGLLLEVTLHPLFALPAGTSLFLLDPIAATTTTVAGFPSGTLPSDTVFGNGGRDLFVATNYGVFVVDTLAATPTAILLGGGLYLNSLAWDRVHRRLYALSTYNGTMFVFDGDRSSPTFGGIITQMPSTALQIATSTDGGVLAFVWSIGTVERRNGDPSSPGYLQVLPSPPSPIVPSFGMSMGRLHLSPDGRVVTVPVTHALTSTEIHRLDGALGQWIDHDATTPRYEPLSASTHALLPYTFSTLASRDGSALILAGTTVVVRVDLDLASPSSLSVSTTPVSPVFWGRDYVALSPSARFLVEREYAIFTPSTPIAISLVEVSTGGVTAWTTLSSATPTSNPPASWR